nr:DUF6290 family protein [Pyramidobacter piscolens]
MKLHSMFIGEVFKRALFDRIEEYDITVVKDAYDEYIKSGKKSRSIRGSGKKSIL